MKIEIRKSFEKDSSKLPVTIQSQLSNVIEEIISSQKLSEISLCKKMKDIKMHTGLN